MHSVTAAPRRRKPLIVRLLIAAGFGIVGLVVLALSAWMVENIRGKAAWARFRAEMVAKGEQLELSAMVPARVPDEENLARTPLLAPLLEYDRDRRSAVKWRDPGGHQQAMKLANPFKNAGKLKAPSMGSWENSVPVDLALWQKFFEEHPDFAGRLQTSNAPAAVLSALEHFDGPLAEMAKAAERPSAVFPVHYRENFNALLPHLSVLKGLTSILSLRALAELAVGKSDLALQDIRLGLRLSDSLKSDPLIVSQMVRLAMIQSLLQPVWEGMSQRRWTDGQLSDLQFLLRGIPILESYALCIRGERAMANAMFDGMRNGKITGRELASAAPSIGPLAPFVPTGWIYQNQTSLNRLYQDRILPVIDPAQHRAYPSQLSATDLPPELASHSPYTILARLFLPAVSKTASKFARQQTNLDMASVAIALERYHNARGQYPEQLADVAPAYIPGIPNDVISGEPLKYLRTSEGRYLLYSVGWDESDEQGGMSRRRTHSDVEGDWTWRY